MTSNPEPYSTPSEHWDDERERLVVRLQRLAAERHPDYRRDASYIGFLREREVHMRGRIDARLGASRASGKPVPLDEVAARLDLAHVERCLLVVTVVLTLLGPDGLVLLREVEGSRYGGRLNVGLVLILLGLSLDARADLLDRLRGDRVLIRSGLVTLGWDPETPSDISESPLAVTHTGLAVLMGREPVDKLTGAA